MSVSLYGYPFASGGGVFVMMKRPWMTLIALLFVMEHLGQGSSAFQSIRLLSNKQTIHPSSSNLVDYSVFNTLRKRRRNNRILFSEKNKDTEVSQSQEMNPDDDDDNNKNFDAKGFASYLVPYALTLVISIAVTAAFVKFVLMDY